MEKFLQPREFVSQSVACQVELEMRRSEKQTDKIFPERPLGGREKVCVISDNKTSYIRGTNIRQGPFEVATMTRVTSQRQNKREIITTKVLVISGHYFAGKYYGEISHKLYLKSRKLKRLACVQDVVTNHKNGEIVGEPIKKEGCNEPLKTYAFLGSL
ncbi:hypothetical protein ISTM_229 [Insectomime virus]|uniref:Uncharacterized protein n=1 Tax=Tunisvirus fontaine2 TaxID=1421067 RepID=V9SD43_9VIRU|nr:hypothetical protein D1R32_gp086 [Tunisvirus fontaine2]AHA46127.1 hypothetical protein ISTM_229 [Insectomime virus]AHC54803.1 hypothetical protein TNS_ORF85 [Tunisvirus fontaine2]